MDERFFLLIYNLGHPYFLNLFFSLVSAVGSYGFIWLVFGMFLKDKLKYYLGFILLTVVVFSLQNFIARPRPYEILSGVIYMGFINAGTYSFPSYHSATSFFGAVFLGEKLKKYKIHFLVLAALISFSRIYLGAHYLTDVLAGGIIGVGVGLVVMKYGRRTNRHSVALF